MSTKYLHFKSVFDVIKHFDINPANLLIFLLQVSIQTKFDTSTILIFKKENIFHLHPNALNYSKKYEVLKNM